MIPDATQWSYSNLTNKKRIPDTNRWIYTNLLKQKWISEATQGTYTNLLNKENERRWIPDANLSGLIPISNKGSKHLDVRCQSIWAYSNLHSMVLGIQMPTCRDLQLYPHIQTNKTTCDHRRANANLQGLTVASSHTIKQIKLWSQDNRCQLTGTYSCFLTYNQMHQAKIRWVAKVMVLYSLPYHRSNGQWMVLQLSSMGRQQW